MVADMVAFVASQFTTSTWDVGAQELCSVVLIFNQKSPCAGVWVAWGTSVAPSDPSGTVLAVCLRVRQSGAIRVL